MFCSGQLSLLCFDGEVALRELSARFLKGVAGRLGWGRWRLGGRVEVGRSWWRRNAGGDLGELARSWWRAI